MLTLAVKRFCNLQPHRWGACHRWRSVTAVNGMNQKTLAIRREDNTVWERRAPLSPAQVHQLVKAGVKVIVQPSNRRSFAMQEYENMGAVIKEDISEAPVIIGVKAVPIEHLLPEKTYVFFSHTIKAQEPNMPLLDAILEKKIRLIDYEKMVDENGRRMVAFGKYAGVAGMINILHGLGLRLLALGHHTPFMHIGPAHNYRNSYVAQAAIRDAGYEVALGLMPNSIGPLTFVFTGSGNVSLGAQEMFRNLPHEYVSVEHLPKVATHGSNKVVYACVVDMEDNLVRTSDGGFDRDEYMTHPDRYASTFSKKIAPYASVIINGIYWAPGAPRLITIPDAKNLLRGIPGPHVARSPGCPQLPHRLLAICDISADPGGSVQFMKECTTINHPFQLYDAEQHIDYESFAGDGVLICSIDNMPAQLPRESTEFFGTLVLPHFKDMLMSDAKMPFEQYAASPIVKNAVITSNGSLTPNFQYIDDLRRQKREKSAAAVARKEAAKKVLLLGAGYVSAPVVDYLTRDSKISVTVASNLKNEVDALANRYPNTIPTLLDVSNEHDLEKLIKAHDLVISLLPYQLHPDIAKLCIKHHRNMVTASYRSPAIMELNNAAKEAGITVVNEVGVDPGIDHMLAMQCFDEVKVHGGKVVSFVSWCGGIPAPENSANPLRYKFNWSPRGVLFNILSSAKYLEDRKIVEIEGNGELLRQGLRQLDFLPGFNIEGFPNRDSLVYRELYGIESVRTMIRGTIRYKGFSHAVLGLHKLGLIDPTPHPVLHPAGRDITWRELLCSLLGKKPDMFIDTLKDVICQHADNDETVVHTLEDLDLFDSDLIVDKRSSPLDTLSCYLAQKLAYAPGERDVLIMRHDVGVKWPDQSEETRHVDFVIYGTPFQYSAMAATVGFPTAIAAKMVLEGEIQEKGMVLPLTQDIYRPIIKRLEAEQLTAREYSTVHKAAPSRAEEAVRY